MRIMLRNTLLFALAVGGILAASMFCPKVYADGTTIVVSDGTTSSLSQIALKDSFDDNTRAWLWKEYSEDPNNVFVKEANRRLELRAVLPPFEAFAAYVGNTWRLDPRYDFAMRVDFHYDLVTIEEEGWIGIGVTPSDQNPRYQRVEFGAGCVNKFRNFSYEQVNGYSTQSGYSERSVNDGTLYISYNSELDELYVSTWGYGLDRAWGAYSNVVRGTWGGRPIFVYLGGRSTGLAIGSGHAYLDNIVIDYGKIIEASLKPVYRFWSPINKAHYYTISETEKTTLINEHRKEWTFQGTAFRAFPDASDPNCLPVHRFWSDETLSHFYTLRPKEVTKLREQYADVWTYQGVAFYAYPVGKQPPWACPVYRFWSQSAGAHYFTTSESEAEKLRALPDNVWYDEGIGWYAVP